MKVYYLVRHDCEMAFESERRVFKGSTWMGSSIAHHRGIYLAMCSSQQQDTMWVVQILAATYPHSSRQRVIMVRYTDRVWTMNSGSLRVIPALRLGCDRAGDELMHSTADHTSTACAEHRMAHGGLTSNRASESSPHESLTSRRSTAKPEMCFLT